jgi:hypothetical protein
VSWGGQSSVSILTLGTRTAQEAWASWETELHEVRQASACHGSRASDGCVLNLQTSGESREHRSLMFASHISISRNSTQEGIRGENQSGKMEDGGFC